jgi:hypothetical protein
MKILPQFQKVSNLEEQNHWYYFTATRRWKTKALILFYLHVSTELNSWTHTVQWKTVKAATGCGIHRLVMRTRGDFSNAYGRTAIVKLWGSSKKLLEQLQVVVEWLRCLSLLWWFESVSCQSVQRCTWIGCGCFKCWRTKSEERRKEMERGLKWRKEVKREKLPFCVYLAGIVDSNDWPVSADQSQWQTRLSLDGTILC